MVGGDFQRVDALGLHVPHEVHEVAAVGFDRVVREQHIADPGDEGPGGGRGIVPVAANAWERKASTLSAAGASPSRKSLRSGTSGVRAEPLRPPAAGRPGD